MSVIRSLLTAFSTYSRIPVPQVAWTEENRRYSMCFFPLIGLITGLILWGWLAFCRRAGIGSFLQGAAAALLPLIITGGIHMDGWMDTTDALASWQSREKRLAMIEKPEKPLPGMKSASAAPRGPTKKQKLKSGRFSESTAAGIRSMLTLQR